MANLNRLPPPVYARYEWQERANCRHANVETFFSAESERTAGRAKREQEAKAYCRNCVVIDACLRHALAVHEPAGVWGGLNASERSALNGKSVLNA